MELKDLIGSHLLSGIYSEVVSIAPYEGSDTLTDCQAIHFVLDGVVYSAIEDPSDGYRSSMRELVVNGFECKNTFTPQAVFCAMHKKVGSQDYTDHDVLFIYDAATGGVVLEIGTGNTTDYYPFFHLEYHPENMAINKGR